jgi:hypothetical protein
MKKAKIFLTALTVLAVVGGALAFKAKTNAWFGACDITAGVCTLTSFRTTLTTDEGINKVPFDEVTKSCTTTEIGGPLTCETFVTTSL